MVGSVHVRRRPDGPDGLRRVAIVPNRRDGYGRVAMKMKAAVLWEPNTDWSVEEVELDPPKAGEVLVAARRIRAVPLGRAPADGRPGRARGDRRRAGHPAVPGDRRARGRRHGRRGRRRASPSLKPGDHVVFGFIPSCGKCPSCSTGHQNLCDLGAYLLAGRQVTDFTARHHARGQDLGLMCCIGTFGEYTVASQASCIKIEDDIPLDKAALVGCGVTTGWGSAVYAADVQPGETVVVVGCGGVGMNAVQGAAMAGARHVVAVDPSSSSGSRPRCSAPRTRQGRSRRPLRWSAS